MLPKVISLQLVSRIMYNGGMPFFRRPGKITKPTATTIAQPWQRVPPLQPRRGAPIVTEDTMMSLPAFYAAMRVTAGTIANLNVLDPDGSVIDVMPKTGSHMLAHPTAHDTKFTYLDSIMWNLLIHGNAFVVPTRLSMATGEIIQTEVLYPTNVVPRWLGYSDQQAFEIGFWIDGEMYGPNDVLHFKEVTVGGQAFGVSKLKVLAHTIGIQLSERAHVKSTYDDGAQPTGYFTNQRQMDPNVAQEYAKQLGDKLGGRGNDVSFFPDNLEWKSVALNHADIQLLQARQWSTAEAASIIGVPPHLIGAATYDSETYSNARMDMAAFEELTLSRYKAVISETFNLHGIDFRFGSAELAQPTMRERVETERIAIEAGLSTPQLSAERLGWVAPPGALLSALAQPTMRERVETERSAIKAGLSTPQLSAERLGGVAPPEISEPRPGSDPSSNGSVLTPLDAGLKQILEGANA